ncbi:MAG: gliding motility-associated ABC transporter permease subunit GldF [Bacteroidetes bacterium]|nr:gliding motility-associated ABC transporter permease subunit GldF [Bacteroidota bacterium]
MLALIRKELNSFLNSVIGYIVIIVFLLTISLFLWIFPDSDLNLLANGYASLDPLFIIVPWVFMFLIPAITMRAFAEEKKSGTLELLLTKPMSEIRIVSAKFLAASVIVLFALLPTLIYYFTIHQLGTTKGNIDIGATWGSYIGLLMLGMIYVSIGIFASSITDNQVVAFITGLFLCLVCFIGFEKLSLLPMPNQVSNVFILLGINAHYISISRGVIDTRDLIYFVSVIVFFLMAARLVLESRKWK